VPSRVIALSQALAIEYETRLQLGRGQVIVNFAQPSDMFESRHAHGRITISFIHVWPDLDCPS